MEERGSERINQGELPLYSLKDALRVPLAIQSEYAGRPTAPVDVALAVGIKPTSSSWRYLTGAAVGYGLITGGSNASMIGLTELGRRIVAPTVDGDEARASREAVLKPTVIGGFLGKYDGNKFPREQIAKNVLQAEFGVPPKRLDQALSVIVANGDDVGFFRMFGQDRFVSLTGTGRPPLDPQLPLHEQEADDAADDAHVETVETPPPLPRAVVPSVTPKRVFISHSRNIVVLSQVKQMLELGDFVPEVAVEQESGAIPVPDKVFDAMRRSGSAIICVTADPDLGDGNGRFRVNPNVLIEIGAAYVLYDRRLILLWDKRVDVPSNLQGLYRCEFEGDELSWAAGTKLQKALLAFKRGEAPES